ncbi:hypothetical protein ACLKA6_011388 [Drosophila palustris]
MGLRWAGWLSVWEDEDKDEGGCSNDFVSCPFYLPAELSSALGCQEARLPQCQDGRMPGCHYLGFALMGFCVRLMKPRWRPNGEVNGESRPLLKSSLLLLEYQPQKWTSPYL